mgnify:CR=1 FL=1
MPPGRLDYFFGERLAFAGRIPSGLGVLQADKAAELHHGLGPDALSQLGG